MHRSTTKILLTFIILMGVVSAKELAVKGEPEALTEPGQYFLSPKWSPDGSQIAVSGVKYSGIHLIDFTSGEMTTLTEADGAGYGFSWSPDGRSIAARVSTYEKYFKKSQIILYSLDGSQQELTEKQSHLTGVPAWTPSGDQVYLKAGTAFKAFTLEGKPKAVEQTIVFLNNLGIYKRNLSTGDEALISPADQRVLHLAISPDASQYVYSTVSEQLWLANMDGSNARNIGRGTSPNWSPDGKWIVGMITEDDGHVFTGADLVVYNVLESAYAKLTDSKNVYEMNPSWSPDGKRIAYSNEVDGRIWVMEVEEK